VKLVKVLLSAVLLCEFPLLALGQSTGSLSGVVTDPTGAVVPNATVKVHSLAWIPFKR